MASRAEYASSRGLWENLLCLKAGLHLLCTYAQSAKHNAATAAAATLLR